jgi:hypothetical protein
VIAIEGNMSTSSSSGRRGPEMKVRQSDELFERDELPARRTSDGSVVIARPFREHLRSTPAAPMSPTVQALLWAAAAAVALLFGAALWKMNQRKPPKAPGQGQSRIVAAVVSTRA